jgi:ABC-type transporter Mla subunit MlaD
MKLLSFLPMIRAQVPLIYLPVFDAVVEEAKAYDAERTALAASVQHLAKKLDEVIKAHNQHATGLNTITNQLNRTVEVVDAHTDRLNALSN